MSGPTVCHRMSYVRHLPEVGSPLLQRVSALDDLVEEQRRIAERYNELADQLQAEVFNFWTPEERRAAQHCLIHGRFPDVV